MKRRQTMMISVMGASLLAGCAGQGTSASSSSTASTRNCFWPSQVNGFSDAGRDQVYVYTGVNDTYLFQTFGHCPDLNFTEHLALKTRSPGMICQGLDVDLIVPSSIGFQRCPVQMIRKLTDDEASTVRRPRENQPE